MFSWNQYTEWWVLPTHPNPDPASEELLEARAGQMDPTSDWEGTGERKKILWVSR
jgi:hypothetical protein